MTDNGSNGDSQVAFESPPADSDDIRLQRIILLMLTVFCGIAGVVWGLILLAVTRTSWYLTR